MYSLLAGRGTERKHWVAKRGKHSEARRGPSATVQEKYAGTSFSTLADGGRRLVGTRRRSALIAAV